MIDEAWTEAADYVDLFEALHEDDTVDAPTRELAAAIASRIYYHLEEYREAVRLALAAGKYFQLNDPSAYVQRLVAECISQYAELQNAAADAGEQASIPGPLQSTVESIFQRCLENKEWNAAIGAALECRRLDVLDRVMRAAMAADGEAQVRSLLSFTLSAARSAVANRAYRREVLSLLAGMYDGGVMGTTDHVALARVLQFLGDAAGVAKVLTALLQDAAHAPADGTVPKPALLAYQIAFDTVDNGNQHFIVAVRSAVSERLAVASAASSPAPEHQPGNTLLKILSGELTHAAYLQFLCKQCRVDVLRLKDMQSKSNTARGRRNPMLHDATVVAAGYMYAGTTVDTWFRKQVKWVGQATHWAKFSATACNGVVHKGHVANASTLLADFLPRVGVPSGSPYVEGGGLYALGLVHANQGLSHTGDADGAGAGGGAADMERDVIGYMLNMLENTHDEVVQHGCALGLGCAGMATGRDDVYVQLRNLVFQDSAVAGESSGIATGLVLLGQGPAWTSEVTTEVAANEILTHARNSAHEKTVRGLAMGLAFLVYGVEQSADGLIAEMCEDKDPVIRYGGMYALGMAYAGSGNNSAVRRLLHVAVSDVSDDVRRAAVTNLGFVLFRKAERVPGLVSLLTQSYNPHVRYGAAMALGIACAGSGSDQAMSLLQPLFTDTTPFVAQGALMAAALVCQQQSASRSKAVAEFRELLPKVLDDKVAPSLKKMGALLALGIVDAGGCNACVQLESRAGLMRMQAVVGIAMWLQHWYWFPYLHFLTLAFAPTALIGVTGDMAMPGVSFAETMAPPSHFAYPEQLKAEESQSKKRVETVQLSTAAAKLKSGRRRRARAATGSTAQPGSASTPAQGEGAHPASSQDAASPMASPADDESTPAAGTPASSSSVAGTAAAGAAASSAGQPGDKHEEASPAPEPTSFALENPARVTPLQAEVVRWVKDARYAPVRLERDTASYGIVVLADQKPGSPEPTLTAVRAPRFGEGTEEGPEPDAPEPFEWTPEQ